MMSETVFYLYMTVVNHDFVMFDEKTAQPYRFPNRWSCEKVREIFIQAEPPTAIFKCKVGPKDELR